MSGLHGTFGDGYVARATFSEIAPRCVLCSTAGSGAGWTRHTLEVEVIYRSVFDSAPVGSTPPGEHAACPECSEWLTDHRDRPLPASIRASIADALAAADLHPTTARRVRAELTGMARWLAEALE